jgi:integral membrane protein
VSDSPPREFPGVVQTFRVIAVIEAFSYLLLIAASIARRGFGVEGVVPVMGLVHGVIFLIYVAVALVARRDLRWPLQETLFVLVAAIIPLGGIVVERRLHDGAAVLRR